MLIVSKYRDYYDSAHNGWIDKTIVYNRSEVRTACPKNMFSMSPYGMGSVRNSVNSYADKFLVIGFCGKTYPVFRITWKLGDKPSVTEFIYDLDEYRRRKEDIWKSLGFWRKFSPWRGTRYSGMEWGGDKIKTMFDTYDRKEDLTLFRAHNAPIFAATTEFDKDASDAGDKPYSMLVNAKLEPYEFYRIKSSPDAFQDIQSFISGVLGMPSKEPEQVSDKIKVMSHGFDPKWSFRKESSKRK